MLKYKETAVVMAEVPDEITLAINIAGCPIHCPDCHSKYLWENKGIDLTIPELDRLIDENRGITCVAFMGGDQDPEEIDRLASYIKFRTDYPYKVAWYSGNQSLALGIRLENFNYIKLGPYISKYGPLNRRTTNQRFYKVQIIREVDEKFELPQYGIVDITEKFWK